MFTNIKNRLISVIAPDTPGLPAPPDQISHRGGHHSRSSSGGGGGGGGGGGNQQQHMQDKFAYARPLFLQLLTPDELRASADHNVRPIIVPRDISLLPWSTGYAECVNSGKSEWNEDQAAFCRQVLSDPTHKHPDLPYTYFGIFDGHAGYGAALAASHQFHHILHEKLVDCIDMLLPRDDEHVGDGRNKLSANGFPHPNHFHRTITKDELIVGALESAFFHMDALLAQDRDRYRDAGGCTACVSLFISGKMYVANAGDSRAVLCQRKAATTAAAGGATATGGKTEDELAKEIGTCTIMEEDPIGSYPVPFSMDHTPETERPRLLNVARLKPNLMGKHYAAMEYAKRPHTTDLGQRILCRQGTMKGWTYKTLTREDLRMPVVTGEGKRSRLLGTLGVTRGFGDHDLLAIYTGTHIKPFLTPHPDVNCRDLSKIVSIPDENNEDGDYGILVMASDGLWDVSENEAVARTVFQTLAKYPTEKHRYTMVAQELVAKARGKINDSGHWRLADSRAAATVDDISVIVIPVYQYYREHVEWERKCTAELELRLAKETQQATEAREEDDRVPLLNGDGEEDEEEIVVEVNRQQVQAQVEEEVEQNKSEEKENIADLQVKVEMKDEKQGAIAKVEIEENKGAKNELETDLKATVHAVEEHETSASETEEGNAQSTHEKPHKSKHHQRHHHQRHHNRKEKH